MNVVIIAPKNYLKKSDKYSLINILEDKTKDIKVMRSYNKITDTLSREIAFNVAPHKIVIVDSVEIKKPRKADYTMADFICDIKENSGLADKNIDIVYLFGRKNINDEGVRSLTRLLIDNGFYSISLGAILQSKISEMIKQGNTREQAEDFYKSLFNGGVGTTERLAEPPKEISVEETLDMANKKENEVNEIYNRFVGNEENTELYEIDDIDNEPLPAPATSVMEKWESRNKQTAPAEAKPSTSTASEDIFDFDGTFESADNDEDEPSFDDDFDAIMPEDVAEIAEVEEPSEEQGITLDDVDNIDDIFFVDEPSEEQPIETENTAEKAQPEMVTENNYEQEQKALYDFFNSNDEDEDEEKDDFQEVIADFNAKAAEEKREALRSQRDDIIERYNNKEPLTEDEFVYVMCDYNPAKDSDIQLSAYTDGYAKYMIEVGKRKERSERVAEVREKYKNKEYLTEDEYLYCIKNFSPDNDSPFALAAMRDSYKKYIAEIQGAEMPPTATATTTDIPEQPTEESGIIDVSFESLSENTNDFSDLSVSNRNAIDVSEPSDESDLHVWDRVTEYERETKEIIGCVTVGVTQLLDRTGCTHISIEVANVLNNNGYDVGICLMNDDTFSNLQTYLDIQTEMDGVFEYDGLKYYNAASLYYAQSEHQIIIIDFGVMNEDNLNEFERARVKLMVCDGAAWNVHKFENFIMNTNKPYIKSIHYLFNLEGRERYKQLFEPLENEGYYTHRVAMSESPFESTKENIEMYFNALESIISNGNIFTGKRKRIRKNKSKKPIGLPFFG